MQRFPQPYIRAINRMLRHAARSASAMLALARLGGRSSSKAGVALSRGPWSSGMQSSQLRSALSRWCRKRAVQAVDCRAVFLNLPIRPADV
jgi:hypothetical protein